MGHGMVIHRRLVFRVHYVVRCIIYLKVHAMFHQVALQDIARAQIPGTLVWRYLSVLMWPRWLSSTLVSATSKMSVLGTRPVAMSSAPDGIDRLPSGVVTSTVISPP